MVSKKNFFLMKFTNQISFSLGYYIFLVHNLCYFKIYRDLVRVVLICSEFPKNYV